MLPQRLPKLLYIGDVPVENSYHGSALLYRLLEDYPTDRLMIIECGNHSLPERRLTGVRYLSLNYPLKRLENTRLAKYATAVHSLISSRLLRRLPRDVEEFGAEAILTVGHGYSWYAAHKTSKRMKLPLHFIVHDDVPQMVRLAGPARRVYQRRFGKVYREASSRMCVSPFMVDAYRERYGVQGTVLYPGRSKQVSSLTYQKPNVSDSIPLRIAFAGTLNSGGVVECLKHLDSVLDSENVNAEIRLYGPFSEKHARAGGLTSSKATFCGLIPADHIVQCLREEADVLFVPISFAQRDKANMSIHFPSKLTDYTACGLPILIFGPTYASAIRWANERLDAFALASSVAELRNQLTHLQCSVTRVTLGRSAYQIGKCEFDYATIFAKFSANVTCLHD